jgi:hypothetical protein
VFGRHTEWLRSWYEKSWYFYEVNYKNSLIQEQYVLKKLKGLNNKKWTNGVSFKDSHPSLYEWPKELNQELSKEISFLGSIAPLFLKFNAEIKDKRVSWQQHQSKYKVVKILKINLNTKYKGAKFIVELDGDLKTRPLLL